MSPGLLVFLYFRRQHCRTPVVQGPEVFAFLLACLRNTYFKAEITLLSTDPVLRQDLKTVGNLQSAHSGA